MGCWNETCMLTNLPILDGEPCVGILLTPTNERGHTSYADEKYQPISPPILGQYDNYGSLGNIKDGGDFFKTSLNQNIFEVEEDGGIYHPATCNNLEELLYKAERETLWVNANPSDPSSVKSAVYLALVKKPFFDFAVNMRKSLAETTIRLQKGFLASDSFTQEAYKEQWKNCLSAGGTVHSALVYFLRAGIDLSGIAALNNFLNVMRMQWIPTSGAGFQSEIESSFQTAFYEKVYEEAKEMYYRAAENS